jgi:hypothetical protein
VTARTQETHPNAKIPTVELPAADPAVDAPLAAVANELTHPENMYLLRIVDPNPETFPKANIPTVPL